MNVPGTTVRLLSAPEKMPCASWSIPAIQSCPFSETGPDTICGSCYARRGHYIMHYPKIAQQVRFDWVRSCLKSDAGKDDFVNIMSVAIRCTSMMFFRVHDSGDLFSPEYTRLWIRICRNCPDVHFWFPTRSWRAPWIDVIRELAAIANVTVRPSALRFDDPAPEIDGLHAGSTAARSGYTCPSHEQGNKCLECRACWLAKGIPIVYHRH